MPNIDHSNIPRWMDAVPIADITTGDHAAQLLLEMYKNLAGHHARLMVGGQLPSGQYVAPMVTNPSEPLVSDNHEFKIPRWLEGKTPAELETNYHEPLRRFREDLAAAAKKLFDIWNYAGLTANAGP